MCAGHGRDYPWNECGIVFRSTVVNESFKVAVRPDRPGIVKLAGAHSLTNCLFELKTLEGARKDHTDL
jgi:hypothetical protein